MVLLALSCSHAEQKDGMNRMGKIIGLALIGMQRYRLLLPSGHMEKGTAENSSCSSSSGGDCPLILQQSCVCNHPIVQLCRSDLLQLEDLKQQCLMWLLSGSRSNQRFQCQQAGKGCSLWQKVAKSKGGTGLTLMRGWWLCIFMFFGF